MKLIFVSDSSLLVRDEKPNSGFELFETLRDLLVLHDHVGLHPGYESLLIDFDPTRVDPKSFFDEVQMRLSTRSKRRRSARTLEIPIVYGGELGPDLDEAAALTKISVQEFIRIHSSVEYIVSFLGFTPGFPYLSGLPSELTLPRKDTPRLKVPAGSVAIGGNQTGIYPRESPGGWYVIGRTSIELFSPMADPPTLLSAGDRVRFVVNEEQKGVSQQGRQS